MLDFRFSFRFGTSLSRLDLLRSLGWALGAIAVVWSLALGRWLLADMVVPWDAKNQSYAFFRFIALALHSGSTPFWNPYHYGGHPSIADPQSLIFAPAFLAWAWFDATPSMHVFDALVYLHLLLGGLALGAVGWRKGWPLPAIVLAAAVFMFGGPASGRLQHTSMILSYALFPPAFLLLSIALDRRSKLFGVLFGVAASLMVLQRTHVSLLLCFVLAAVLASDFVSAPDRRCWLRERRSVLAVIGGTSLVLLVVPLLLTLQFTYLSNRPAVSLHAAHEASLYPANLASMAVANVMGSLEATENYWGPNYDTLPEVGATDRSFNYMFIGAATVVVLLWFGIAGGGLVRRGRRLLTAALVLMLAYTLGRYTPVYALAFQYLPGINFFRRPVDGAFVLTVLLAIFAGQLLTDYVREGLPRSRWWATCVVAAALGLIAWAVVFATRTGHGWDAAVQVWKAVPIALISACTLWWARRSAQRRIIAAACIAVLASGELLWWNAASSLNAEAPSYYSVLEAPTGDDAAALAILKREIDERQAQGDRPRIEVVGVSGSWQNLAMTQELEATNGYNPLRIGWYDRLVSPGETTYIVDQRLFPSSFDGYDSALARELGLEYLVLGRPIEEMPHLRRRPVADALLSGPNIWIYRLADPEPRVRLISRITVANVDAEMNLGKSLVNAAAETAMIDARTVPSSSNIPGAVGLVGNYAQIVSWQHDRIEVEVDSLQPGVLVLHDLFYPGWFAEVDGVPAPILRANVLFRGVEVGAGRHSVVFRFAPLALANLRDAFLGLLQRKRQGTWSAAR